MAKSRDKDKPDRSSDESDLRAQIQSLNREQMLAIARYVPAPDRWVASHPWMSSEASELEYIASMEANDWQQKARKEGPDCPGASALNMLRFALSDNKSFWLSYWKKCDEALKRAERHRMATQKQKDKPEDLDKLRESLDSYLSHHRLTLADCPPEWYTPPSKSPVVA